MNVFVIFWCCLMETGSHLLWIILWFVLFLNLLLFAFSLNYMPPAPSHILFLNYLSPALSAPNSCLSLLPQICTWSWLSLKIRTQNSNSNYNFDDRLNCGKHSQSANCPEFTIFSLSSRSWSWSMSWPWSGPGSGWSEWSGSEYLKWKSLTTRVSIEPGVMRSWN